MGQIGRVSCLFFFEGGAVMRKIQDAFFDRWRRTRTVPPIMMPAPVFHPRLVAVRIRRMKFRTNIMHFSMMMARRTDNDRRVKWPYDYDKTRISFSGYSLRPWMRVI